MRSGSTLVRALCRRIVPPFLIVLLILLSSCSGGGSAGASGDDTATASRRILRWAAPVEYVDGTTLSPLAELDVFEIYLKPASEPFSDLDTPDAAVRAVPPGSATVTTSFDLSLITETKGPGSYRVSLRAVAASGLKSAFSPPLSVTL